MPVLLSIAELPEPAAPAPAAEPAPTAAPVRTLSELLTHVMERTGWCQADLATVCQCHRATICRIVGGSKRPISVATSQRLAHAIAVGLEIPEDDAREALRQAIAVTVY